MKLRITILFCFTFIASFAQKTLEVKVDAAKILSDSISYPEAIYAENIELGIYQNSPIVLSFASEWKNGKASKRKVNNASIEYAIMKAGNTYFLSVLGKVADEDGFLLSSFTYEIGTSIVTKALKVENYASNSVLASGDWIKVKTSDAGIHKITYSQLRDMGISNPEEVAVFGNGGYMLPKMNNESYYDDLQQNPIFHTTDAGGNNCIFFYVPGTTKWIYNETAGRYEHQINGYSENSYYFLTDDVGSSLLVGEEVSSEVADTTINEFTQVAFIEDEDVNLLETGRQFFGDKFANGNSRTYNFHFDKPLHNGKAIMRVAVAARASVQTHMLLYVNNVFMDSIQLSATSTTNVYAIYARENEKVYIINAEKDIAVTLRYASSESGATGYTDHISLNVESDLALVGDQVVIQTDKAANKALVAYQLQNATNNTYVWNVTDFLNPIQLANPSMINSGVLSFKSDGDPSSRFVAFDKNASGFPTVTFVENVANQNIHGEALAEMIIVTHPDFYSQAEALAEFHETEDDMRVLLLTTEEVYNEFSSGMPDVSSIRNLARMFYKKYSDLRYLLLMGDGHYNNHLHNGSVPNFIPTYQTVSSLNPLNSYTSDDYFALLDDDEGETRGLIDLGVGRITCKTPREATAVVDKILNYSTSSDAFGNWRNVVCFIADDEDSHVHMEDSETLIKLVDNTYSGFFTDKIYFDSYEQVTSSGGNTYPEVNEAITRRVEEGTLILNYIGHANPSSLADEDVLSISEINSWSNYNSLPIFVTATCEFSRFDGDNDSAGERVLLNPSGGGVGLFSTTRVVYSAPNFVLSRNFYNNVFGQFEDGTKYRLGDIMRYAKNATTLYSVTNKRCFALLSDPALQLAFPKYTIKTDSVNGVNPDEADLTIGALEKIEIKGSIVDVTDELYPDFNGEVQMTIYDKEVKITTMNNDNIGSGAFTYNYRDNIIYKGSASVTNGEFKLSFIVPKDISYSIGKGKIYYYAVSDHVDANGSNENVRIGGSGNNPLIENNAPEIEVYLNDRDFNIGDAVASSVLLLVDLADESGINTVGAGIGHDLVGILDGDYGNPIILNDYYASQADSYQKGTISFPMSGLTVGEHTLEVKVWDVQNNSATAEIKFKVVDGYKVEYVQNWPNPVSTYTDFTIKHNLPGEVFDVTIDIYQLNGNKVASFDGSSFIYEALLAKVRWNLNDSLNKRNQMLVYKVVVTNQDGQSAFGAGKLILSNY